MTTVARACLEHLASQGVETVFGLPGVHNLSFWRDCDEDMLRIIVPRHEQTTTYAADGLARSTGGLGVALTTTGPGAANTLAAFGEAAASQSPVLVIATEISTKLARAGARRGVLHESADQAGMFEPLAKAVYRPRTAAETLRDLRAATATAMQSPRGPVYLDVPTDVLGGFAPSDANEEARWPVCGAERPTAADMTALATLLDQNERVVLWCGGGVVQSGAETEVRALAERIGAPVVTTFSARGCLPPEHPMNAALPPHEPEVADLIGSCDLLLAIGTGFDGMTTRNWQMPMPPRLAVVNVDAEDAATNYRPDLTVVGDAAEVIGTVTEQTRAKEPWMAVDQLRIRARDRMAADPTCRDGLDFVAAVDEALPPGAAVVCDMAVAGYWYGGYGRVHRTRQLQYPVGWGTLGYAFPAAVGPASAGRRTLAICGDGGVMFALSELATVAAGRLPVTLLIVDDASYGMLAYDQQVAGDPERGVALNSPDWDALGRSLGVPTSVHQRHDVSFDEALAKSLCGEGPGIVVLRADLTPPRTTSPRWFAS